MMKQMEFDEAVKIILQKEGGYVDDSDDSGGETKFGISKKAYPDLDIKNLTRRHAEEIYRIDYWVKIRADLLPARIRLSVFDFAVNAGASAAVKMLQRLAGVKMDGKVGPVTSSEADKVTPFEYASARIRYYKNVVKRRPKDKKFLKGWTERALYIAKRSM